MSVPYYFFIPWILYCGDNSTFAVLMLMVFFLPSKGADDGIFHVVGELVVVHEVTMASGLKNLKRLLALCGDRQVFILTPLLRYAHVACCKAISHSIHGLILDFAVKSSEDLRRLHSFIASRLSAFLNSKVIHSLR